MRRQGDRGIIIHLSTILAFNGVAGFPSSAPIAAKGGIAALTKPRFMGTSQVKVEAKRRSAELANNRINTDCQLRCASVAAAYVYR
jgi:hypothetical protein